MGVDEPRRDERAVEVDPLVRLGLGASADCLDHGAADEHPPAADLGAGIVQRGHVPVGQQRPLGFLWGASGVPLGHLRALDGSYTLRAPREQRRNGMVRTLVLWERAPDPDWYAEHAKLAHTVPGATFTHGRIFGSPDGNPDAAQYAEFEFPDMESFKAGMASAELQATVADAQTTGIPFRVYFTEAA